MTGECLPLQQTEITSSVQDDVWQQRRDGVGLGLSQEGNEGHGPGCLHGGRLSRQLPVWLAQ